MSAPVVCIVCPLMPKQTSSRCFIIHSYWFLRATIASKMPCILCSILCGTSAAQKPTQTLSSIQSSTVHTAWESTNNTSLPLLCYWCRKFTNNYHASSLTRCTQLKLVPQPSTLLSVTSIASTRSDPSCLILVDSGTPHSLPGLPFVAE